MLIGLSIILLGVIVVNGKLPKFGRQPAKIKSIRPTDT